MNLLLKYLTPDNIATLVARCIASLLEFARGKSDEKWDKAKSIVEKINKWTSLFVEVYSDENLTVQEEEKIADAIKNSTTVEKIAEIITDKTQP